MIEELLFSKTGLPVASVYGIPIHSLYDPAKEAARFVASKNITQDHTNLLLIAPGFCYLVPPLRKLIPSVRILALQCSSFYQNHFESLQDSVFLEEFKPDAHWSVTDSLDLYRFLENEIDDHEASTTKILEWRPSTKAYGAIALKLLDSVADYLKRVNANALTSERFGKKWIRNSLRFIHTYNYGNRILKRSPKPIVVMASGPSLEGFIQDFRNPAIRNQCSIMALSSAVDCLLAWDITPDIIVATDGGNWAKFHLFEGVRKNIPLAISIMGALPSQYFDLSVFAIINDTHWQQALIMNIATPVLIAPQRGTVAATAIDLALSLTDSEIYIAGLDLGVRNGRSHARPNALDRFYDKADNRLHPAATGNYHRYLDSKQASALDIYAKWFSAKSTTYGKRLVVLGKPCPALSGFRSIETLPFKWALKRNEATSSFHVILSESNKYLTLASVDSNPNIAIILNSILEECGTDILDTKRIREGFCGELLPLIDAELYRILLLRCRMKATAGKELVARIMDSVKKQLMPPVKKVVKVEEIHG